MRRFSIYSHAAKAPKPIRNANNMLRMTMLFMVMTSQSGDRVTKIHITMDSAQEKINNALKVLKFVHS